MKGKNMETWYMTKRWTNEIEEVEVERSSEKSIWIEGNRVNRVSNWRMYFPSKSQAFDYLVQRLDSQLSSHKANIQKLYDEREKLYADNQDVA